MNISKRRAAIIFILAALLVVSVVSTVIAVESSEPIVAAFSPADGTQFNSGRVNISFTVSDPDLIASSNYYIKVNGRSVPSSIRFRGHYEYDSCGGSYWVVDGEDQATISGTATGLGDGVQNVEIAASDRLGNTVVKTWTFNVAQKPVLSTFTPANGSIAAGADIISVKVTDNGQIDESSISMVLNGESLSGVQFDPASGLVSYVPPAPLADGKYNVSVTLKDTGDNQASSSWSFNVSTSGPQATFANDGQDFTTYKPTLSINLKSVPKLAESGHVVEVDGQAVGANFQYKGHTEWDSCGDYSWYVVDSYYEGTLTYVHPYLTDGEHTLTVKAKDSLGNISTNSWTFGVQQKPVISGNQPTGIVTTTPVIKATISDPNGSPIDMETIVLKIDNTVVTPEIIYDNSERTSVTLTYTAADCSDDREHSVYLEGTDAAGNTVSKSWTFYGSVMGTATGFTNLYPTGTVYTAPQNVSVHFTDLENKYDVNMARIIIDGYIPTTYYYDSCGSWSVEHRPKVFGASPEYTLTYTTEPLGDGDHTIEITIPAKDGVSPNISTTMNFTVKVPPSLEKYTPDEVTGTKTPQLITFWSDNYALKPDGSGSITDPSSFGNAQVSIDGQEPVIIKLDPVYPGTTGVNTSGRFTYRIPNELEDGRHTVTFTVYDVLGNAGTGEWDFIVDTDLGPDYPDMPLVPLDEDTCHSCHAEETPSLGGSHPVVEKCYMCHTEKTWTSGYLNYCSFCHNDNRGEYQKFFTWRHTGDGYSTFENIDFIKHPINDAHISDTKGCQKCHSRILTDEHNGPDRTDASGNAMTCDTCHMSSDAMVKEAISNRDSNCTACHESADHETVHTGGTNGKWGLDENCLTCHSESLTGEHLDNEITNPNKGYTCDTCHGSAAGKAAQRTIAAGRLNCSGCHTDGHNLLFADSVPGDIPVAPGFGWSLPMEAAIFTGESSIPGGYENGQVVISNRRSDVTAESLWAFYNDGMTAQGWTLKAGAPAAGAVEFTAEFEKEGRFTTVNCFNTENRDGTGPDAGYRVEVWYK